MIDSYQRKKWLTEAPSYKGRLISLPSWQNKKITTIPLVCIYRICLLSLSWIGLKIILMLNLDSHYRDALMLLYNIREFDIGETLHSKFLCGMPLYILIFMNTTQYYQTIPHRLRDTCLPSSFKAYLLFNVFLSVLLMAGFYYFCDRVPPA